mgnify:CR=1 FL=1
MEPDALVRINAPVSSFETDTGSFSTFRNFCSRSITAGAQARRVVAKGESVTVLPETSKLPVKRLQPVEPVTFEPSNFSVA